MTQNLAQSIISANAAVTAKGNGDTYQNLTYSNASKTQSHIVSSTSVDVYMELNIQAGAQEGQNIQIKYDLLRTSLLGIEGIDTLSHDSSEAAIGMVGMVGTPSLPASITPWEAFRVGALYSNNILESYMSDITAPSLTDVDCIDGLLMATQYDIPWREDLFKEWDFYDVSQSFEFHRANYRVVVPKMDSPWVIHDDGLLNLDNYENEKEIFKKEYL